MKKVKSIIICVLFLFPLKNYGERVELLLNKNWAFRFSHQVEKNTSRRVDIPHTWNAQDALSGKKDYKRGIGNYQKNIFIKEKWRGKRLFLRFEGANSVANVFVNGKHIGEHRGGYGAFVFEITQRVQYGKENELLVRINNGEQLDVMPLVGDFNFGGGLYRDVHLLITDELCISPLDYASPGVYLIQKSVTKESAKISTKIKLSSAATSDKSGEIRLLLKDGAKVLLEKKRSVLFSAGVDAEEIISFDIENPRLWNGRKDPFMYDVEILLYKEGTLVDRVSQPLGLRFFQIDPNKGFFLNGEHLPLRGVCRHQDRAELNNALHFSHHEEDVALMLEMGVNAVRLAHYPQATAVYDLMDKHGLVTWAEIPFIGPGGYADKGFVDQESFKANGKEQLVELIRQHYNHPAIIFWGLFNELKEVGDNPVEYIKELNELSKQEDPTRLTTSASNQDGDLNFITDNIAWNRYDGWYGGLPSSLGRWLDATHKNHPKINIGLSEYGAGASIYHQQDTLIKTNPTSWWHPENWQTFYHIENWKIISNRPFVWGSFVWNMFDFGAAHRTEGDRPGVNDKGLVTFDRKVRKDAFYFYKANWNKQERMIHLTEKRLTERKRTQQSFMVFTTEAAVELFVNGKSYGKRKADKYATVRWEGVALKEGNNLIKVTTIGKNPLSDELDVFYNPESIDY